MKKDDYFGVDLDAIWETVEKDIPSLKNYIINLSHRARVKLKYPPL
jgi:uncharacterized protein with HEPN domain